jgi:uncharacterized membrane protein
LEPGRPIVRALWTIVVFLSLIAVTVAIRRLVFLAAPSPPPARFSDSAAMDAGFARHAALTIAHIIPGLLFILLGPFQFVRALRQRRLGLHRWMGRIATGAGMTIGGTALVMSPRMAIGGANETAATVVFATLFLYALARGYGSIRRGQIAVHREWMIRAYAIGLAVATVRPIVGMFFATSRLTRLTPRDFFGTAFWLGFTLHLIAAEAWINHTRGSSIAISRAVASDRRAS